MAFVTIAQVNSALKLDMIGSPSFDTDDRKPDIELKIKQAEDIVLDFVQPKPDPVWTVENVPGRVSAAAIMVVGYLLDDSPEAQSSLAALGNGTAGEESPVAGLLWRLRKPSMA